MLTKILIADSCEEFRQSLTEQLKDRYSVRSCSDGLQALSLLDSFCPDLLIVDLMLPYGDGLKVLKAATDRPDRPATLVTSVLFSEYASAFLERVSVSYAMRKPCDMTLLVERIDDMVMNVCIPLPVFRSPYSTVTAVLLELGMNPSRGGFSYCREAIVMLEKDPGLRVTKDIYPQISRQYNTSVTAVEKNIRDVIAAVWKTTGRDTLAKYFKCAANGQIPRPSNHVFMSTLAEQLFTLQRDAK